VKKDDGDAEADENDLIVMPSMKVVTNGILRAS